MIATKGSKIRCSQSEPVTRVTITVAYEQVWCWKPAIGIRLIVVTLIDRGKSLRKVYLGIA